MPSVRYTDEVQVILTTLHPPSKPALRERHLVLSDVNPCIPIGRTSKRVPDMAPSRENAWIDSAVMSRKHAELSFDSTQKKVFVRDTGSLHGTFQNGVRLAQDKKQTLTQGDILKFGIAVERNAQDFPPSIMKVTLNYGTETRPKATPLVFRVPDDSDMEDDNSTDEDMSIQNSSRALRENGIRPAQPTKSSTLLAIDLTSDEELNAEGRITPESPTEHRPEVLDEIKNRVEIDEALDDWEDYDSSAPSPVPFPVSSPPLHPNIELSGGQSDNEPISGFGGDMELCSSEDFELDQGSLPSPTCQCDEAMPEQTVSLPSIGLESPATEEIKQSSGILHEPIHTLNPAGFDAEHRSTQYQPDILPSIDSDHGLQPGYVQLPPISDAMGTAASIPPHRVSQQSVEEILGEKTGKLEYFSARSFNKRLATATVAQEPQTPSKQSVRCKDRTSDHAYVDGISNVCDLPHQIHREYDVSGVSLNDVCIAEAPTSALLASGAKFLSSPPHEPSQGHSVPAPPELDETSAYQFELSKKAARTDTFASNKRTHVAINDLVDAYPIDGMPEDEPLPKKRKAADISKVSSEVDRTSPQPSSNSSRPETRTPAPAKDDPETNHPTKRIRRAAEVFGYVALGGVAVMSALIASAPTL